VTRKHGFELIQGGPEPFARPQTLNEEAVKRMMQLVWSVRPHDPEEYADGVRRIDFRGETGYLTTDTSDYPDLIT
jgi:hypothetical protein